MTRSCDTCARRHVQPEPPECISCYGTADWRTQWQACPDKCHLGAVKELFAEVWDQGHKAAFGATNPYRDKS